MAVEGQTGPQSDRKAELLEAAYAYVLAHGIAEFSLRPLAAAAGSSPRVLLYLFGSKDELIRALLARSRTEELQLLGDLRARPSSGLGPVAIRLWEWLAGQQRRGLLTLWLEGYTRSLVEPAGPWAGFARSTVTDWLALFADHQAQPETRAAATERTQALAILRGALLDLLATGEADRLTDAVHQALTTLTETR